MWNVWPIDGSGKAVSVSSDHINCTSLGDNELIRLGSPQNMTASCNNGNLNITWSPVANAKNYEVDVFDYAFTDNSSFSNRTVNTQVATNSYTKTNAPLGGKYGFSIFPLDEKGRRAGSADASFICTSGTTTLPAAANLTAKCYQGKLDLTWDAVAGAEKYLVHVYPYPSGNSLPSPKLVDTQTTENKYHLDNAPEGGKYMWDVFTQDQENKIKSVSNLDFICTSTGVLAVAPVANLEVYCNDGKLDAYWDKNDSASQYEVNFYGHYLTDGTQQLKSTNWPLDSENKFKTTTAKNAFTKEKAPLGGKYKLDVFTLNGQGRRTSANSKTVICTSGENNPTSSTASAECPGYPLLKSDRPLSCNIQEVRAGVAFIKCSDATAHKEILDQSCVHPTPLPADAAGRKLCQKEEVPIYMESYPNSILPSRFSSCAQDTRFGNLNLYLKK